MSAQRLREEELIQRRDGMETPQLTRDGIETQTLNRSAEVVAPRSITVIWIHGAGDSFAQTEKYISSTLCHELPHVRFVLPVSPVRWCANGTGNVKQCWWNYRSTCPSDHMRYPGDVQETESQCHHICEEVRTQIAGGASQIFLGGFAQGGQLALLAAKSFIDVKIAGVIVFSGLLPLVEHVYHSEGIGLRPRPFLHANLRTPVFMAIAKNAQNAQQQHLTAAILRDQGCVVQVMEVDSGHSRVLQELPKAAQWIKDTLMDSCPEEMTLEDGRTVRQQAYYNWQGIHRLYC
jgi:predicted esterase